MGDIIKRITVLLCLVGTCLVAGNGRRSKEIPVARLGEVLSCLNLRLTSIGAAPPRATSELYHLRYFYGVVTSGDDRENELQLLVYAPNMSSAVLYRLYFEESDGKSEIDIGDWATFKGENGRLVPNEFPGGVATYSHILKVLHVMSKTTTIDAPLSVVRPGPDACIFVK
jgi:hypothetical protein